jgi:Zn-dependent M16 (insulinase) family peptidase
MENEKHTYYLSPLINHIIVNSNKYTIFILLNQVIMIQC